MSKYDDILAAAGKSTKKRAAPKPEKPATVRTPRKEKPDKPLAKSVDPNYEQVSAYLPKKLNSDVATKLREQGKKRGFSDLLEQLLAEWLKRT